MIRLDPASAASPAPARALRDWQIQMLTRLAEIGLAIAEAAGVAATSPQRPEAGHQTDPGLTYARAARAVRMTIALQSRLMNDFAALDRAESLAAAARANARRERVHRLIDHAIEAEGGERDEDEIERLSSDAWERLVDLDDADLADRPLGDIVAAICRDLGLPPDRAAEAQVAFAGPEPSPRAPRPGLGAPDLIRPGFILADAASLGLVAQPRGSPPTPAR